MMQSKAERTVVLRDLSSQEALEATRSMKAFDGGRMKEGVPQFSRMSYEGFQAQHSVIGNDLVVQFFLPKQAEKFVDPKSPQSSPEARAQWMSYWLNRFPSKLDVEARTYFEADYPRLLAKYTEELASWWFKARGFGASADPTGLVTRFYERLNAALKERT